MNECNDEVIFYSGGGHVFSSRLEFFVRTWLTFMAQSQQTLSLV